MMDPSDVADEPPDRPDEPRDAYEHLRARIETITQEVDALQIQVGRKRPAWRRGEVVAPIIVSAAALIFTIYASITADARITRQDEHAARAELRGLIQRLQGLPKERFDINRAYPNPSDAPSRNFLQGQVTGESIVLAQQAADLIDQLGGDVGAQEYSATAGGLTEAGQWTRAEELLTRGLFFTTDALSEATLLRHLGGGRFVVGDVEGGRAAYTQALRVFDKYPDPNRFFVATTQAYTEAFWAQAETGQRNCAEARSHLTAADTAVGEASGLDAARILIEQTRLQVQQACGQASS